MNSYAIRIEEVLGRTVIVAAESLTEAIEKVEAAVDDERIVLDYEDYCDREIKPSDVFEGGLVRGEDNVSYYDKLEEL